MWACGLGFSGGISSLGGWKWQVELKLAIASQELELDNDCLFTYRRLVALLFEGMVGSVNLWLVKL